MNCLVCKKNEVVYSGIDAFILGIPTEKFCYDCANAYAMITKLNEENNVSV